MEDIFTVYALYSSKYNKIYIGFTSNLIQRFHAHNFKSSKGFTHKFRPWIDVHCEYFLSKQLALKREQQLKTAQGRNFIRNIIHDYYT